METTWIYFQSEIAGKDFCVVNLWTVGFYDPSGKFHPESDHSTKEEAAARVHYLNGGDANLVTIDEAIKLRNGI